MADKDNQDNVIDFPAEKVRPADPIDTVESSKPVFDLERKKMMVSASILSIVFAVTVTNSSLLSPVNDSTEMASAARSGRAIASTPSKVVSEWETDLASLLSKKARRGIASVGRQPTTEDRLLYGALGGKNYRVMYKEGKLAQITFEGDPTSEENKPQYLTNPSKFLKTYSDLFPVSFSKAVLRDGKSINNKTRVYQLLEGGKVMAEVKFDFDRHQRLLTVDVSKMSNSENTRPKDRG